MHSSNHSRILGSLGWEPSQIYMDSSFEIGKQVLDDSDRILPEVRNFPSECFSAICFDIYRKSNPAK